RSFNARLDALLTGLVAASAADDTGRPKRPDLSGQAFQQPFSGWYWQIKTAGANEPLHISNSLLDQTLKLPSEGGIAPDEHNVRRGVMPGPEGQRLRILEREIAFASIPGNPVYSYAVAGDASEIEYDVGQFTTLLATALFLLGLGLVAAMAFQVRFGLRPLRAVRKGLAAIRSGEAQRLEGDLPEEIAPLQEELNALIRANHDVVERARTHVGNLAHALKTPLSVITNEARGKRAPLARKVVEQADVMRAQITHHLDRARMAASAGAIHSATPIDPVFSALMRALERIYEEKGLTFTSDWPTDAVFQGEKHDLEEMVGNLLDNACKWANSEVALKIMRLRPARSEGPLRLAVFVDDDGPGLSRKKRESALKRGRRLDESKPGSGLGLSIVSDLAHVYKGTFKLKESPMGGLRARLELPEVPPK
ncbi:MAG: ATP-binding protein, partial [Pseudomonadota bacterium]|nr:ATP-binding protein [Pseudomonadota bacterium]